MTFVRHSKLNTTSIMKNYTQSLCFNELFLLSYFSLLLFELYTLFYLIHKICILISVKWRSSEMFPQLRNHLKLFCLAWSASIFHFELFSWSLSKMAWNGVLRSLKKLRLIDSLNWIENNYYNAFCRNDSSSLGNDSSIRNLLAVIFWQYGKQ